MNLEEVFQIVQNGFQEAFSYLNSPDKRIYYLYLISCGLMAYFVYVKARHSYSFFQYLFNRKIWTSKSARIDYYLIVLNSFVKILLVGPYLIYGLYLAFYTEEYLSTTFGLSSNSMSRTEIMVWYTITLTILNDLTTYLVHLILHKIPWFWEFHKVHHSATVLNPVTQYRIHPVELILNNIRAIIVFGFTMGFFDYLSTQQIMEWEFLGANVFSFLFMFFGANLRHSHVKLKYFPFIEYILISPFQHQIHHSNDQKHYDKNMGSKFAVWDWMFGTLIRSRDVKSIRFGLGKEDAQYNSLLKNLYMPFVNIGKSLIRPFRKV